MDVLMDRRGSCMSRMLTMRYPVYREIMECACSSGGIRAQRETLKSSSAIRIRSRMMDDIVSGAVLPPIVLGLTGEDADFAQLQTMYDEQAVQWLKEHAESLSLIDGVQRTTALQEATMAVDLTDYRLRVELWIARDATRLVYRRLVLHAGLGPRDIRRELEAVSGAVFQQIQRDAPDITILCSEDGRRRGAGQYPSEDVLELYLAFGARKTRIDTAERLSDPFMRLDFLDATASDDFTLQFAEALSMMGMLDRCFGRGANPEESEGKGRFRSGIDIFGSQAARVGFIVSTAMRMLGRPGNTQGREAPAARWKPEKRAFLALRDRMRAMDGSELSEFLALPVLSERLAAKRAPNGDAYEQEFFKAAFETLYDECGNLSSLEACWNAY